MDNASNGTTEAEGHIQVPEFELMLLYKEIHTFHLLKSLDFSTLQMMSMFMVIFTK